MICSAVQRHFTALFDGDMPESSRQDLELHILVCKSCREAYRQHCDFLRTCDEFLVCPGPPHPFERIRERLPDIEPLDEVLAFVPKLRIQSAHGRLALACVMVLMVSGMPWGMRNTRQICSGLTEAVEMNRYQIEEACEGRFPLDPENPAG